VGTPRPVATRSGFVSFFTAGPGISSVGRLLRSVSTPDKVHVLESGRSRFFLFAGTAVLEKSAATSILNGHGTDRTARYLYFGSDRGEGTGTTPRPGGEYGNFADCTLCCRIRWFLSYARRDFSRLLGGTCCASKERGIPTISTGRRIVHSNTIIFQSARVSRESPGPGRFRYPVCFPPLVFETLCRNASTAASSRLQVTQSPCCNSFSTRGLNVSRRGVQVGHIKDRGVDIKHVRKDPPSVFAEAAWPHSRCPHKFFFAAFESHA